MFLSESSDVRAKKGLRLKNSERDTICTALSAPVHMRLSDIFHILSFKNCIKFVQLIFQPFITSVFLCNLWLWELKLPKD